MTVSGTELSMVRGDTESITVTCPAAPFQAGDVLTLTIREGDVYGSIVLQKTISEFGADGSAVINIEHGDTTGLEMGSDYVYDIQLVQANGNYITIIKPSKFTIEEEVTY